MNALDETLLLFIKSLSKSDLTIIKNTTRSVPPEQASKQQAIVLRKAWLQGLGFDFEEGTPGLLGVPLDITFVGPGCDLLKRQSPGTQRTGAFRVLSSTRPSTPAAGLTLSKLAICWLLRLGSRLTCVCLPGRASFRVASQP